MESKRNWSGNGINVSPQKSSLQNGMEIEWKRNGNFATKQIDAKYNGNGTETDWKWNGNKWH